MAAGAKLEKGLCPGAFYSPRGLLRAQANGRKPRVPHPNGYKQEGKFRPPARTAKRNIYL